MHTKSPTRGFTLLIAVITASIVLTMGMSILNITLKEFLLSGAIRDSEMAFYAADAGIECVMYYDQSTAGGKFAIGAPEPQTLPALTCGGQSFTISYPSGNDANSTIGSGEQIQLEATLGGGGNPNICTRAVITKTSGGTCPAGAVCTEIVSSGYNRSCATVSAGTDPRIVERRLRTRY